MGQSDGMSVTAMLDDMSGSLISKGTILALTSATLVPLNGITACGYSAWHNTDSTNFVTIRNGSTGADLARVRPGKYAFFELIAGAAPYLVADTASCYVQFFIASA